MFPKALAYVLTYFGEQLLGGLCLRRVGAQKGSGPLFRGGDQDCLGERLRGVEVSTLQCCRLRCFLLRVARFEVVDSVTGGVVRSVRVGVRGLGVFFSLWGVCVGGSPVSLPLVGVCVVSFIGRGPLLLGFVWSCGVSRSGVVPWRVWTAFLVGCGLLWGVWFTIRWLFRFPFWGGLR